MLETLLWLLQTTFAGLFTVFYVVISITGILFVIARFFPIPKSFPDLVWQRYKSEFFSPTQPFRKKFSPSHVERSIRAIRQGIDFFRMQGNYRQEAIVVKMDDERRLVIGDEKVDIANITVLSPRCRGPHEADLIISQRMKKNITLQATSRSSCCRSTSAVKEVEKLMCSILHMQHDRAEIRVWRGRAKTFCEELIDTFLIGIIMAMLFPIAFPFVLVSVVIEEYGRLALGVVAFHLAFACIATEAWWTFTSWSATITAAYAGGLVIYGLASLK
eukprot:CAMPEP_0170173984 /NCGR_PEP_ID=MMETSP0040_2-20121228/7246_1 /TAXON_ID=641309 /ORGANISM="Lotharella oceanica, Strain CCMP622" /LENGTH=273 /DNA_ID=CAMNT_0010415431 /DNA_START=262 /DNA_END=1083 /DNA_ORIENTATION=-